MTKKQRSGIVVSDKMDKTVVVQVERVVAHSLYGKSLRRRRRYKAHDETNVCRLGDRVMIEETRPLSKQKHWRVVRLLERREVAEIQPREIDAEMTGIPSHLRAEETAEERAAAEAATPAAAPPPAAPEEPGT